jgi:putative sterol carrier protein
MTVKVYSNEWAEELKDEVNRSSAYKSAAKGWKWSVGLVVEAEPDKNFPQTLGVVMDLFDGDARGVTVGAAADAQKCDFVITAPYTRWKEVANKLLDPTKGMLQGKLKLKGDLPTIVRYTKASQELVECTTRLPVEWPDEK